MSNWVYNYSALVGPQAALDEINRTVTPDGDFDFDRINPTPAVLEALGTPTQPISDEAFAEEHNLEQAPKTVDELVAFAKDYTATHTVQGEFPRMLLDIPETVHSAIVDEYGYPDWYAWRDKNWGTRWTGGYASARRFHKNLLLITFDTAWSPPEGVFSTLRGTYEGLHIINGVIVEGFFNSVEVSEGSREAFLAYFAPQSGIDELVCRGESYTVDGTDAGEGASMPDEDLYFNEDCDINEQNIQEMIDEGALIGEGGESPSPFPALGDEPSGLGGHPHVEAGSWRVGVL